MKYTARFAAVILAMTLSLSAFAAGQFKDIQRAMMDSKWGQAEEMLLTYTAKDPNNGKGHFLLATVYEQTRRYAEAKVQLDKAFQVAPDKRWASPGQADAMNNRLEMKLAMNNPKPRADVAVREPVRERERVSTYTPPARQTTQVAAVAPVATQTPAQANSSGGHGFLTFMLFVLAIVAICGGIWYYMTTREEKRQAAATDDTRRAMLATVVAMQERLQAIRDKLKYQNKLNSELGNIVDGIASSLNTASSVLRDRGQAQGSALQRQRSNLDILESQLSKAEGRLGRKEFDPAPVVAAPAPVPAPVPRAVDPVFVNTPYTPPNPVPAAPPRPVYQAPTPAPAPSVVHHHHTTVVHDNSGSDLLTAVVIADVMSNSRREDELRRERQMDEDRRQREFDADMERQRRQQEAEDRREQERQDREDREQERRDAENERRSAPAMDFGGNDDSSSSRDDSPAMDLGGDDD